MSRQTPATPKPEEHYRVASVLEVLAEYGIHVARETINRVSDTKVSSSSTLAVQECSTDAGPETRLMTWLPPSAFVNNAG